ncbi:hypothetical protein ABE494_06360 [Stenotrophomonas lactitubi]|uniref:hypothetical protein n=1 Tax=Stenotrophomonas lactitubi TaxID=2045214 RepID=UPI00203EB36A|nr:hypothetical protein [Stenotrophomonas lactitubi]
MSAIHSIPLPRLRAAAVGEVVHRVAARLGYGPADADFAAALARQDFLSGRCSAARAISDMVDALRTAMQMMRAQGGAA